MAGTEKNYDGNPLTRQLSHSLEQGLRLNQFTFLVLNASDLSPDSRLCGRRLRQLDFSVVVSPRLQQLHRRRRFRRPFETLRHRFVG